MSSDILLMFSLALESTFVFIVWYFFLRTQIHRHWSNEGFEFRARLLRLGCRRQCRRLSRHRNGNEHTWEVPGEPRDGKGNIDNFGATAENSQPYDMDTEFWKYSVESWQRADNSEFLINHQTFYNLRIPPIRQKSQFVTVILLKATQLSQKTVTCWTSIESLVVELVVVTASDSPFFYNTEYSPVLLIGFLVGRKRRSVSSWPILATMYVWSCK